MQLATSLRLLALAMQLSKLAKALVLCSTNVPTRTENTMPMTSARMPAPFRNRSVDSYLQGSLAWPLSATAVSPTRAPAPGGW